jgi:hypothetical protein
MASGKFGIKVCVHITTIPRPQIVYKRQNTLQYKSPFSHIVCENSMGIRVSVSDWLDIERRGPLAVSQVVSD